METFNSKRGRRARISETPGLPGGPRGIKIHLPVAEREIRVAAHDRAAYRTRVIIATSAMLTTAWFLSGVLEFSGRATATVGQNLFAIQAWAALIFACGAFVATVDSISREKREGTLGLLFLTTLKGRDVILGKLVSELSLFVVGALAALPILSFSLLLGGVRPSQCFHLLLSLLNTALFSGAAVLLVSSLSVTKQKAAGIAILIVVFFCLLIPISVLAFNKLGLPQYSFVTQFFTPVFPHQLASGSMAGLQTGYFYLAVAIHFSMACALLAAASWVTPRSWQQGAKEPLLKRVTERYAAWSVRTTKSRSQLGRALLDRNAYEWLASRKLSATTSAWSFIAMMLALAAAVALYVMRRGEPYGVLLCVSVLFGYILQINAKIRVGGHACDRFVEDRDSGAMELLLCTPLSVREMIDGEFRALRRRFFPSLIVVAALLWTGLLLSREGLDHMAGLFGNDLFKWGIFTVTATIFFLALDSTALAWAGVWCGIGGTKTQRARGNAMALVLTAPFILCGLTMTFLGKNGARLQEAGFLGGLAMMVVFVSACDLAIIIAARRWLFHRARARLTEPQIQTREYDPLAWIRNAVRYSGRMRMKRDAPPAATGSV